MLEVFSGMVIDSIGAYFKNEHNVCASMLAPEACSST